MVSVVGVERLVTVRTAVVGAMEITAVVFLARACLRLFPTLVATAATAVVVVMAAAAAAGVAATSGAMADRPTAAAGILPLGRWWSPTIPSLPIWRTVAKVDSADREELGAEVVLADTVGAAALVAMAPAVGLMVLPATWAAKAEAVQMGLRVPSAAQESPVRPLAVVSTLAVAS